MKIDPDEIKSSVKVRLFYIIDMFGLKNDYGLAHAVGISRSTIKSCLDRDRIGPQTARKIADKFNLSVAWVEHGCGEAQRERQRGITVAPSPWLGPGQQPGEHARKATVVRDRINIIMETFRFENLSSLLDASGVEIDELNAIWAADSINAEQARKLSNAFGVEYEWILNGRGPFQAQGAEIEGYKGFRRAESMDRLVFSVPEASGAAFLQVPKGKTKLSGGGGIIPDEGMESQTYSFREDWLKAVAWGRAILFDMEGDSMSPTLWNGDTVLIDLGRTELRGGQIYAIAVADVVQIKRLQLMAGPKVRIISDNPAYHTYEAAPDDIRILGQMIWSGRTWI